MDDTSHGTMLLAIAHHAIAEEFGESPVPVPQDDWLRQPGATFVTLTQHGQLRGCIGSIAAHRPLAEDVYHNARAAAFGDPRFMPLGRNEWAMTRCEVSLLTPALPMSFRDEADALAQLRPGTDGVVFEWKGHHSTFLPQVWEQLPDPREFMAHLKQKAGLPSGFWDDAVKLSRYTVNKWREKEFVEPD